MHLISLDEQGEFEDSESTAAKFIAGCIYDDRENEYDLYNERKRIIHYYQSVCDFTGCDFPKDLHFSRDEDGNSNSFSVKKVKEEISSSLSEFIKKGTYKGNELLFCNDGVTPRKRIGQYYIYAMVKSKYGKENYLGDNISILTRDDVASNLYVHMAESLINRLLFHNPIIGNMNKVSLELATRQAVTNQQEVEKELKTLGYKKDIEHSNEHGTHFYLTDADIYRTAIEREMIRTGKASLQFEKIASYSIRYNEREDGRYEHFSFLYLADSICAILGFYLDQVKQDEFLDEIYVRASSLVSGSKTIVLSYDLFDDYYQKALDALDRHDYFNTIESIYAGLHIKNDDVIPFYEKYWLPLLWKKLKREDDERAFAVTLSNLQRSFYSNKVDQEEYIYLFQHLESMDFVKDMDMDPEILYQFYDIGISIFSNIGDSKKATECYDNCSRYAKYVGIETYLNTRNRMVVFLLDEFKFESALQIAQENVVYYEELTTLKELIFEQDEVHTMNHAKALSQLGQAYAYNGSNEAEDAFLKALRMFEKNSYNYQITLSYLLHYYLDSGEKDKYGKYVVEYFGGNERLSDQLKYILQESTKGIKAKVSLKYALYLFVKGVYLFYLDEIDKKTLAKIRNIEDTAKSYSEINAGWMKNHPWEIIYKYIALIEIKQNRIDLAEKAKNKIRASLTYSSPVLEVIPLYGELSVEQKTGTDCHDKEKELSDILASEFQCEKKPLREIFRYMYD